MLFRRGGAPEPSVIGNVDVKLSAIGGKAANFSRIDSLVANKCAKGKSAREMPNGIPCALAKTANFAGDAGHNSMNQGKRFVLAKGHEVNLVIGEDVLALRIHQNRAVIRDLQVVRSLSRSIGEWFPLDYSREKRMLKTNRQG